MDFPQRVNGWALYAHPCFQETYDALVAEVETLKGKDPENYQRKAATKLLAVVHKVIEEHITVKSIITGIPSWQVVRLWEK